MTQAPPAALSTLADELSGLGAVELGDFRIQGRPNQEYPSSELISLTRSGTGYDVVYNDRGEQRVLASAATFEEIRPEFVERVLALARDRGRGLVARRDAADPQAEQAAVRAAYVSAVRHGRRHRGVVFRGRPADPGPAERDGAATTSGLLATSRDLRVATENLTAPGVYAVLTRGRGRLLGRLSTHPDEQEVAILPDTRLVVAATFQAASTPVVVWVEDGPAADDDPTPERIGAYAALRLQEAAESGPVAITSPGRYLGRIDEEWQQPR